MRQTTPLLTFLCLLLANTALAQNSEYWAACDGCGNAARNFATGIPEDRLGVSTVNVYDNHTSRLSAFAVTIYYDYEFRAWSRFAQPTQPSAAAVQAVADVVKAREEIAALAESSGAVVVDIPDVQTFLLARGGYDRVVSNALFDSWRFNGLLERFSNAVIALGSNAARVVGNDNLNPQFQIVFQDGSTALVTTFYLANADGRTELAYVADSARLPDGTRLPDSSDDFENYYVGSNNPDTINAIARWARVITGLPIISQTVTQTAQGAVTFVFRCDDTECVLTAISDSE